ncbi:MAG: DegT/DnrJ/EryC1/StrS aminotransferase [Candidatus Doudnabacteria bacterium CG10_big_fil_rev_8_21_14_0_10_42_18]|uniref:DegT/DnrJ/EryC1/StrS aminotransferase n=1 Tax=Candidatus Doudnabacteria bacterium CG10_big_fil_rev_8_21_14_0_10_42_18 TaxID=1974552 RepID=A0A2H0VC77_9BACT|nr:MAG: DegT/DnrJ/EryC1/StrS aminotransferase [Candidatus Doudnabacteria bacterium CG10_big_fil_rev_8_21_14_0_10_42_18]
MIKLTKSSFFKEVETKQKLCDFLSRAEVLSMNEECSKFEITFAKKQGRRYAVFVSSGSMANLILIQSLLNLGRLKKEQRVGFSALTWPTNVMPLIQLGLEPVPVDCEMTSLNVSVKTFIEHLDSVSVLFLTNVLGLADDLENLAKFCKQNGILLIEDNCEALGSKISGKLLGNFSSASTFSFFVGHHLSTIEGGMVCTDDEDLYEMLLMVRAHGWDRNLPEPRQKKLRERHKINNFYSKYTFYELAYNARPTEISGFLGNLQMEHWEEIIKKRQENFSKFSEALKANLDFFPLELTHMERISNFAMPVVCRTKDLWKRYTKKFEDAGVEIRPIIAGDITKQPFYMKYAISKQTLCPNTALIHEQGFYFPNNPELKEKEIVFLCELLRK